MNTTEITIDGTVYNVNLEEAKKLGLIKKKVIKRRVKVKDVPIGSVFVWENFTNKMKNQYVLINRFETERIECTYIDHNKLFNQSFGRSGLTFHNHDTIEGFYDQTGKFISEIEESGAN